MSDETHTDSFTGKLSPSSSSENFNSFEHIQNDDSLNQSDSQVNNNQSNDDHQTTTELFNGSNIQDQTNHNETFDNSNGEQQQQQTDDSNNQEDQSSLNKNEEEQSIENNSAQPLNNDQSLNSEHSFQIEENEGEEIKPQRELDEEEIPPADFPVDQTPLTDSTTTTTTPSPKAIITDDRPLTQLEDPFGNHQEREEEQFSATESSPEQLNNHFLQENEINEEHPLENPTLSSFLPDVIHSTTEDNATPPIVHEEPVLNEKSPSEFTSDDFPPLPPPELPAPPMVYDKEFPPLPSANPEEILLSTADLQTEVQPPVDVLGNRTLFKQTLVKGQANTRPTRSTTVTISYTLTLVDTLTSNSRVVEEIQNEKYFVSENDLIPAIDICVQLMDRGESCLVESDVRHGYGDHGCEEKHIPPVTTLNPYKMKIQLELHDWTSPLDIQLLSVEERLFWSEKKKGNGNFHYRRQDYKTSLQCYHGAARFVDLNLNPLKYSSDQNQTNILIEKYILIQNNVAQVYLLLNKYEDCLNAVENVLKFDSKNVKALFRQGKAFFELGKYQEAIQTLKTFLQIPKGNSNATVDIEKANELINIAENKLANYQKSEREIYQRMFRPTTPNNQQQTKTNNPKQTVNSNDTNWLPYLALGAAALAVIGYVAFTRFKKAA